MLNISNDNVTVFFTKKSWVVVSIVLGGWRWGGGLSMETDRKKK